MINFNCLKCGKCCTKTLSNINENIFGLYLTEEDIRLFPSEFIFPLFGRGNPIIITAYQLGISQCPHFRIENGIGSCFIQEKKPLVCLSFPILDFNEVNGEIVLDNGCNSVCLAKSKGEQFNIDSLKTEINAHIKKENQMIKKIATNTEDEYMWPLNKKEWIEISKIYGDKK